MSAELIPNSHEWLLERRKGIGASDAAVIVYGQNYNRTQPDLWRDIQAAIIGEYEPMEATAIMQSGHILEPVAAQWFADDSEMSMLPSRFCRHEDHPFITATPDRFDASDPETLVEIKRHRNEVYSQYGDDGSDEIPASEWIQVQHQMLVTGAERVLLVVLFGDESALQLITRMMLDGMKQLAAVNYAKQFFALRIFEVSRDCLFLESLLATEVEWYEKHIIGNVEPVDIRTMTPGNEIRLATADEVIAVAELHEAHAEKRKAAEAYDDAREEVEKIIGEDCGIKLESGERLTWKKSRDSQKTDWKAAYEALIAATATMKIELDIDAIKEKCTSIKPGARRFVVPTAWQKD